MFGLRINDISKQQKLNLEIFLYQNGIDVRPMFYSIKNHDYLKYIKCNTNISDKLQGEVIILPSFPDLTDSQIDYISDKLIFFIENKLK